MHANIFMSSSSSLPLPSAANSPAAQTQTTAGAVDRVSTASFPPTVWADGFLNHRLDCASLQAKHKHPKHEVLKQEVRKMVIDHDRKGGDDETHIADKLRLIDAVQRLGVAYHFEKEIGEALERVHDLGEDLFANIGDKGSDLYHEALRFRLLRQQGFPVSLDGLRKLKGSEGKFKEWLAKDEKGLLSLYEATHMAFNGEDILDELQSFATKTLKHSIFPHKMTSPSFQKQIDFALRVPAWKCVPRSLARHSIDFYSENASQNGKLLTFAKLDFNMVQSFHQQELSELADWWWGRIDVATNFPYTRDRLMESYYAMNSVFFEPNYGLGRTIATKVWSVLSILDDTYDNFATYEEAWALTEAIDERLDGRALQELPDSMKKVYSLVLNLYDEIEREVGKIGPTFGIDYLKREVKRITRAFMGEVQWKKEGRVPTLEEYMIHGYATSGMPVLCTSAFVGLGAEIATREAFEWVNSGSKLMKAAIVIGRYQDDIFTHKFEQERDHSASAVQCYMEEYSVSEEEAVKFLWKEVSNAWKDIAEECQKPSLLPVALTNRLLNLARLVNLLYDNGDCLINSHFLKDHLTSLFIDPVPL